MFTDIINQTFLNTEFVHESFEESLKNDSSAKEPEARTLVVDGELIRQITYAAFSKIEFYFRQSHIDLLCGRLDPSSDASENDRFVIKTILDNACVASQKTYCLCQDTGTACVYVWKDDTIKALDLTASISKGVEQAWKDNNLRASQIQAISFFEEQNTSNNLPAQINVFSVDHENAFYDADCNADQSQSLRFLFVAKGGGSANKTSFYTMSKSILSDDAFESFLYEKINALGTSACPPYRLAVVVGGLSPEQNLEVLKFATTEILDCAPYLPCFQTVSGTVRDKQKQTVSGTVRDKYWEDRVIAIAKESGLGAQAGGTSLVLDARVLRLPRHAASCFVSIGVSCCAHRNMLGYINKNGAFLEKLQEDINGCLAPTWCLAPKSTIAGCLAPKSTGCLAPKSTSAININLNKPLKELAAELRNIRQGNGIILISGKIITARDAAHLKWHQLIKEGKALPSYLMELPVFYAGPSGTPAGKVIGSIGPTTAERMDVYAEELFSRGASLVTIAKGKRSRAFYESCEKWGAVYLSAIGGAAAITAQNNIKSKRVIDYSELQMEACCLLEVENMPVFCDIKD
ncbi:MAG: fumarate hydratase [Termitinemataceae bacterium]|nr:MAG: fumarate hydratase [Termitinemataceae bacterium]